METVDTNSTAVQAQTEKLYTSAMTETTQNNIKKNESIIYNNPKK